MLLELRVVGKCWKLKRREKAFQLVFFMPETNGEFGCIFVKHQPTVGGIKIEKTLSVFETAIKGEECNIPNQARFEMVRSRYSTHSANG